MKRLVILLAACGGAPPQPMPQPEPPPPAIRANHEPMATIDQCERLLEHLIDLELVRVGGNPDPAVRKDAIDSKRDEFNSVCTTNTSAARVDCALRAVDLDGVEKCDHAP